MENKVFSKSCPVCTIEIFYKRKSSLKNSIRLSSMCKKCGIKFGKGITQETKDKISKSNKGKKLSDDHRLNLSKARIGKKF